MALTKTITEIQEVLPKLVSKVSKFSLTPNWERVEGKYIVPIIGTDLYNTLTVNYNAETMSDDEAALVKHIRLITAAMGYKDELGLYVVTLGDSGAIKLAQGGTEPIRGWEMQRLENALINAAMDGTEILLNYLFANKDLYLEWTDSDQYKKISSLMIRSGTEFNDNYTLFYPQRSFFIMRGLISDVQKLYIIADIGDDLFTYLRDVEVPAGDLLKCIEYVKKAICFYTVAKACNHYSVSFSDGGFTILGEKNSMEQQNNQPPDMKLLEMKIENCIAEGNAYLGLAKNELYDLYNGDGDAEFKEAFAAGPMSKYILKVDRTSGNEERNFFVF